MTALFECHRPGCSGCQHCWSPKCFGHAVAPLKAGLSTVQMKHPSLSLMAPEARRACRESLTSILLLASASLAALDEIDAVAAEAKKQEAA